MWWSRILTSCSALYLDSLSPIKHNLHHLHARWEHVIAAPQRCIDILCYVVMAITGETKYYMSHAFSFEWYNIVYQRCWVKWFRRLQCYSRALWDSVWCDISAAKPLCSALTYISCSLVFLMFQKVKLVTCVQLHVGVIVCKRKTVACCLIWMSFVVVGLLPHGQKCILSVLIMFCYFVRMFQECGAWICCLFGCPL